MNVDDEILCIFEDILTLLVDLNPGIQAETARIQEEIDDIRDRLAENN